MLNIETKTENEKAVVALEGRLDTNTAPDLRKALDTLPDSLTELDFDLEKLDYISSAGIRVMLAVIIDMGGKCKIKALHPNEDVLNILEMTGLTEDLTTE